MEDSPITEAILFDPVPPSKPKTSPVVWIVGAFVVLVLMAGAAFVGGRFLLARGPIGFAPLDALIGPGNGQMVSIALEMEPAPELPGRTPDASGMYVRRDGNAIVIQQMMGGPMVSSGGGPASGNFSSGPEASGPEIEIVVTENTQVYKDTTTPPDPSQMQSGTMKLEQTVELMDNADEIGQDYMVQVWGERRGDRLIAQVIFYAQPMVVTIPAGQGAPPAP